MPGCTCLIPDITLNTTSIKQNDVILLRKPADKVGDGEMWVGLVLSASGTMVKFDWLTEKENGEWTNGKAGWDRMPRKDVIAKIKNWNGKGTMPPKLKMRLVGLYED